MKPKHFHLSSSSDSFPKTNRKSVWKLLLLIVISVAVYINILTNEFVWDDSTFILEWKTTKSFANLPQIIKGVQPETHAGKYRPVKGIILMIDHALWGTNPSGYHAQAILINTAVVVFI